MKLYNVIPHRWMTKPCTGTCGGDQFHDADTTIWFRLAYGRAPWRRDVSDRVTADDTTGIDEIVLSLRCGLLDEHGECSALCECDCHTARPAHRTATHDDEGTGR